VVQLLRRLELTRGHSPGSAGRCCQWSPPRMLTARHGRLPPAPQ
jgi:hypothetical protein